MPLNPAARAAIHELASEGVSDLTPEEVVDINDCGQRLIDAGAGDVGSPPPIDCGGLLLHHITLAAADFIEAVVSMDNPDSRFAFWSIVCALVHGRNPERLERLHSRTARLRECMALRRKCTATMDALRIAVTRALDGDPFDKSTRARDALVVLADYIEEENEPLASAIAIKARAEIDRRENPPEPTPQLKASMGRWAVLAAELGALTGVPPDYWLASHRRVVVACYETAIRREAMRMGTPPANAVSAEVVDAVKAMQELKSRIANRRREKPDG